jgi:hypothetical protein
MMIHYDKATILCDLRRSFVLSEPVNDTLTSLLTEMKSQRFETPFTAPQSPTFAGEF